MNHLRRELAPFGSQAWNLIEEEARDVLKTYLAARKFVDFSGPHGWPHSSVNLGRARGLQIEGSAQGVETRLREVAPLIEVRIPFELSLGELDNVDRGASDIDLDAVTSAAQNLAKVEDRAIFFGVKEAGISGIVSGAQHEAISSQGSDFQNFAHALSAALSQLRRAGVDGPYGLALDVETHTALLQLTGAGGYPMLQYVHKLLDGPVVWAPALEGALLFSMRGGDFELVVGQDISVGYQSHSGDKVQLYLEESFTFQLNGPEAAIALR